MIQRFITDQLIDRLQTRPVVFLNGPRQVGKSTLVQWLAKSNYKADYFNLDDINILSAIQSDPIGFLSGLDRPVILDEIQRAPDLFLSIKAAVDSNRRPGQFLLTGSSHLMTLSALSDALVGRMAILSLFPLSTGEINGNPFNIVTHLFSDESLNKLNLSVPFDEIERVIHKGGYPEIVGIKSQPQRSAWFNDYLNTIIQHDIKDISNIVGIADLPRLLRLLSSQTGQLLNLSNLSRKTGIEIKTLKRYVVLLESVFVTRRLPAWFSNVGKRMIKTPKLFFNDTGLLSHLLGAASKNTAPEILGSLLENYILLELLKMATWSAENVEFFYYRTTNGVEVDIVMENDQGKLVAIEIKRSATLKTNAVRGIKDMQASLGEKFHRGVVFYTGDKVIPIAKNIHALPVGVFIDYIN